LAGLGETGIPSAKRPRRKAKQDRAQKTIDTILEAAARVLARHGYAAATTNRIAVVAGVSIGTVYEYFGKKEEVFEALIQRELDALVLAIRNVELPPDTPIDEKLRRVILAAMTAMRYGPELFRSLDQVPGATFRRRLFDARKLVIDFVKELLAQSRAELRVADLDLAAFLIVSAAEGVGGNATRETFDARMALELETMIRVYLTGGRP
jgi:AcrR family transcriptional regulator